MEREWRFSEEHCHVLFTAFWENAENPRLRFHPMFRENLSVWLEVLRGAGRLVIAPAGADCEFFPLLVEQEFLRLARFEAEDILPCGCEAVEHRYTLQQFRIKNLLP